MANTTEEMPVPKAKGKEIVVSGDTSLSKSHGKEIVAQTESTDLLTLKPTDLDKSIHIKVYRKWTIINKASLPSLYCCILLDKQVHSFIFTQNCTKKYLSFYLLFPFSFRDQQSRQILSHVKKTDLTFLKSTKHTQ